MTKKKQLNVIARAPFEIHYEGPAKAVSATNRVGPFDVLPGHADFFSVLEPGDVTIDIESSKTISFPVNAGIITARDDEIHLFVNM